MNLISEWFLTQSDGDAECADCISAFGLDTPTHNECLGYDSKSSDGEAVAEPISMSTPQMSYVNENSQNNMKEQRRGNNNNKWQFICRIYKRVCKCPRRLYVVFS